MFFCRGAKHQHIFWGVKLIFVVVIFFGHVQLLRFVVVKIFRSCSNLNSVIFILSCELASIKAFLQTLMTTCSKLSTFFIGLVPALLLQQELIGLTKKCINVTVSQKDIVHSNREISLEGEGALPLVQLSISFLISCFDNNGLYFLFFSS